LDARGIGRFAVRFGAGGGAVFGRDLGHKRDDLVEAAAGLDVHEPDLQIWN
jgi:hypothetical protein